MASNVPLGQVRDVVIAYILGRCEGAAGVASVIFRWGGLVGSLTGPQEVAQEECILSAQKVVAESGEDNRFWLRVLKGLYDMDVITEDAVFAWYKSSASRKVGGEAGKKLWVGAKPFVEALMEDSDEEESD